MGCVRDELDTPSVTSVCPECVWIPVQTSHNFIGTFKLLLGRALSAAILLDINPDRSQVSTLQWSM